MAVKHIVKQGEHLSTIAKLHGFENFETIWNHPDNAQLRKHREHPHALLPDDEVVIPAPEQVIHKRGTGVSHRFQVHVHKLKLRLRLRGLFGEVLANSPCVLTVGSAKHDLTTDDNGFIEVPIDRDERFGHLKISGMTFQLLIGDLDPLPEPSAVDARMRNLGYPVDDPQEESLLDQLARRSAVEFFQHDRGKRADGELTPLVVDELAREHGC